MNRYSAIRLFGWAVQLWMWRVRMNRYRSIRLSWYAGPIRALGRGYPSAIRGTG